MFFLQKTLVIIPVHNEEGKIAQLINDLKLLNPGINYLIIDDNSTDNTAFICQKRKFNIISLANKWGIDVAIETGYKYALKHDFDYVITFLGGYNYKINNINNFVKEIDNRYDVVFGNQFSTPYHWKKISRWEKMIAFVFAKNNPNKIYNPESRMNLVSKEVIEIIFKNKQQRLTPLVLEKLIKNQFKIKEINLIANNDNFKKNRYYFPPITFCYWLLLMKKKILKL